MKTLKNLSEKEKKWALIALCVALGAAAYLWVVEPFVSHASAGGHKMDSKKTAFKKSLKNLAQMEALQSEFERLALKTPSLAGKEDITGSLGNLEKMAGECSVSIASIKPQSFDQEDGSKLLQFEISASADPAGLARFLYRLETSPYLLRVKRFTVTPGSQASQGLQCTLLVTQLAMV